MIPKRGTQFLARDSYRLRRLMDAARFLPVFGLLLLLLPLMRGAPDDEMPAVAGEAVFLFLLWAGLVGAAFLLSLGLRRALDEPTAPDPPDMPGAED